jgi:glycerol-3-phosphate dehydrogenase (NAD(P)+)
VIGPGNWGTTLAHLVATNGHEVTLWTRDPGQRDEINLLRTNTRYTPGLAIAPGVRSTTDLVDTLSHAELVIIAIPSQSFREVARLMGDHLDPEQVVIHGTKGFEVGTHRRMSEILQEETCARQIGVLAGPNIAPEVVVGMPAGTVIASPFPRVVELGRRALSSPRMMVFAGTDVLGVEVAGALKNVVAISAGMADEMGLGDNSKAFLVTRGMTELMRLASAMGAESMTLTGLAGMGDLIVTCASRMSRNHRIGVALAQGEKLDEAIARLGMVAEGVYASLSARALAKQYSIDMPLFERVDRVLHEGLSPREALEELMGLPAGRDVPSAARRAGLGERHA